MRRLKFNLFNIRSLDTEIVLSCVFVLLPVYTYTRLASSLGGGSIRNVASDAVTEAFGYVMDSGVLERKGYI